MKKVINSKGLKVNYIATELGITPQGLSFNVTTKKQMTPEFIKAIEEVYGDVDTFIDLEIEKQVEENKASKKKILKVVEEDRP